MKTWARIETSVVIETFSHPTNPKPLFDPSWTWVECPPETQQQAAYDGELFTNPPSAPVPGPVTPLEVARAEKHAAINVKVGTVLSSGFTVPSGVMAGKVLQTRDSDDRINWLVSQASYSAAVAAGAGAVQGAEFRTADNMTFTKSYAEGLDVLLAMAAWGAACMKQSWSLKDAVAAAEDLAALDAIDIEVGWP